MNLVHSSLRRKHYLQREDTGYLDMFPYSHLRDFLAALTAVPKKAAATVAEAISHSEGLRGSGGTGVLAVRMVHELGAQDRSFVTYDATQFRLDAVVPGPAARYVEASPERLRFSHYGTPPLTLDIDVDLWEILMRMRDGYVPSRDDLRGSWISLQTFKEQIASMPSKRLLIQPRFGAMTRVEIDSEGRIAASAAR